MNQLTHLTHFVSRFKALTGGETVVLQLTKELAKMGVKSTIVTRSFSDQCNVLRDPRVEIQTLGRPWNWTTGNHLLNSFLDTWLSPALVSRVPSETDGLIFHAEATPFALWWARTLQRSQRPCIYFCYQPPQFAYYLLESTVSGFSHLRLSKLVRVYAPVHRWFDQRWVRQADAVWTFSMAYANWCRELYSRRDVAAIPPGVDFDRFRVGDPQHLRREWDIPDHTTILLTVNKLIPRKNIDVFIAVVAWLRDQGHSMKGIIAGDGPIRRQLEEDARQAGLNDEVVFAGHVAAALLPHYYAGADVHIFLEQNVPFGLTPLEAGAAGTPSIAPRGGGTTETIIHGKTGFLVDDDLSIPQIGGYVQSIVQDEQRMQAMQRQAREHARAFTWQRFARQVYGSFLTARASI